MEDDMIEEDRRSQSEIVIFQIIQCVLMIARFMAIVYFLKQAVLHYRRYQGEKRDNYTFCTFLFLGLSVTCLFIYKAADLIETMIVTIYRDDVESLNRIEIWLVEHDAALTLFKSIVRTGFGYLFQNLALLVNIQRWKNILKDVPTQRSKKRLRIMTVAEEEEGNRESCQSPI